MKYWKRFFAVALSAAITCTSVPVQAKAFNMETAVDTCIDEQAQPGLEERVTETNRESTEGGDAELDKDSAVEIDFSSAEDTIVGEDNDAKYEEGVAGNVDTKGSGITFNLGSGAYEVPAEEFDEEGYYTIELGTDPFFPYEVQFGYGDNKEIRWFEDIDDVEEVFGHKFMLHCDFTGNKMTQMFMQVGDDEVAVRPKEKDFKEKVLTLKSRTYKPVKTVELELELSGYTPLELAAVSVKKILAGKKILASDHIVLANSGSNDYKEVKKNGYINFLADDLRYGNEYDISLEIQ